METSYIELPSKINIEPHKYYKTTRDVCYWTNERNCKDEIINNFTNKAKEYNLTEDQALAILMFNNFDFNKAQYDVKIYKPIKGLDKIEVKQLVKIISGGIIKTVKSRQHRDFDDVTLKFPGYTVGDVLGAYSKHRFLVKKETFKVKKSLKKATLKPYLSNGGLKEIEAISWNDSCLDTQFQLVYRKHYGVIQDSCNFKYLISRDISDLKHFNGINDFLCDTHEADVILSLLKKMNRKRNKHTCMFEKTQLSNILSSVTLERQSKSANTTPIKYEENKLMKSLSSVSTNFDRNCIESNQNERNKLGEMSIEDQMYDYIKNDNICLSVNDKEDYGDQDILDNVTVLFEKHETVLNSFKDYLPDPNIFQQHCHSWSNMDFAILLLGLSEFGKDFDKISDSIFTKSVAMVASFYFNHSSELNLDDIVMQPSINSEVQSIYHNNSYDKNLPFKEVKIEEIEDEIDSVCNSASNTSTRHSHKSFHSKNSTKSKKSSLKSKKIKVTKDCSEMIEQDIFSPIIMNLRSHVGNKNIMKDIMDEEIKLKNINYNSKKNLKRKVTNKDESKFSKSKRTNVNKS